MKENYFRRFLLCLMLFSSVLWLASCEREQKIELSQNRGKWESQHFINYRYKLSILSYWGANYIMPLSIQVKDEKPILILDKDGNNVTAEWKDSANIDSIFAEIDNALSRSSRKVVEIRYDQNYGFPTYFDIFYDEKGVGGEYDRKYTISDFEIETHP